MASFLSLVLFLLFSQQILVQGDKLWVSLSEDGQLHYETTSTGDRIMDFSAVGYKGFDSPTPGDVPVRVTLHPLNSSNDGIQIKNAIDHVSSLPVDSSTGFRGAIQFSNGTFDVRGHYFLIKTSGIVIKGSGETILHAQMDRDYNPLFRIQGAENVQEAGSRAYIVSNVPSGSDYIEVDSISGFHVGDIVNIVWPQTEKWINMMKMASRWSYTLTSVERVIKSIENEERRVFFDIPIPFRIDLSYLSNTEGERAYVVKFTLSGRVNNVGIENLKAIQDKVPPYGGGSFLNIGQAQDCWVKNVAAVDFGGDTVNVYGKRMTFDHIELVRTLPSPPQGPKPADFAIGFPGSQILVKNSIIRGGDTEFNYITRDGANGPNVFFNSTGYGLAHAQPHSHFATGILYDNMVFPSGGSIDLLRRDSAHHGYTSAYSVVWNSKSSVLTIINPPQAANWAIGCRFQTRGDTQGEASGFIEKNGIQSEKLHSLYLAQKAVKVSN